MIKSNFTPIWDILNLQVWHLQSTLPVCNCYFLILWLKQPHAESPASDANPLQLPEKYHTSARYATAKELLNDVPTTKGILN